MSRVSDRALAFRALVLDGGEQRCASRRDSLARRDRQHIGEGVNFRPRRAGEAAHAWRCLMYDTRTVSNGDVEALNRAVVPALDARHGDGDRLIDFRVNDAEVFRCPGNNVIADPAEFLACRIATDGERERRRNKLDYRSELRQFQNTYSAGAIVSLPSTTSAMMAA